MNNDNGFGKDILQKLKEQFKGNNGKRDKLLLLFLAGIVLLVFSFPKDDGAKEQTAASDFSEETGEDMTIEDYTKAQEERLEEILSQIDGAGDVSVMITYQSSAEKVVEKDTEQNQETVTEEDSQGGNRTTRSTSQRETAVYNDGDSDGQSPYISKEITPQAEGVVVIAPGGDNAVVTKNITEAVQALFGVDTHKIRIVKGRREI